MAFRAAEHQEAFRQQPRSTATADEALRRTAEEAILVLAGPSFRPLKWAAYPDVLPDPKATAADGRPPLQQPPPPRVASAARVIVAVKQILFL